MKIIRVDLQKAKDNTRTRSRATQESSEEIYRRFLFVNSSETLQHLCRLDFCRSLMSGLPSLWVQGRSVGSFPGQQLVIKSSFPLLLACSKSSHTSVVTSIPVDKLVNTASSFHGLVNTSWSKSTSFPTALRSSLMHAGANCLWT